MANKGSGREAAKVTDWKNLSPKCPGVGKGIAPMHVNAKPALLHYVTVVMSDLRSAIEKLTRVEYEIMYHIIWGRKIPVALVKHLETTRKGLIEPTYKLGRLADTWKPLVTVFYDDARDEHEFSAIGDQEMFDYLQECLEEVGADFRIGYTVGDIEEYQRMDGVSRRPQLWFLDRGALDQWLHGSSPGQRPKVEWPEEVESLTTEEVDTAATAAHTPALHTPAAKGKNRSDDDEWDGGDNPPTPAVESWPYTPQKYSRGGYRAGTGERYEWREYQFPPDDPFPPQWQPGGSRPTVGELSDQDPRTSLSPWAARIQEIDYPSRPPRGDVPLRFPWNDEDQCYKVEWGRAGDLSRRFIITQDALSGESVPEELPSGDLFNIPNHARLVHSHYLPQLKMPEGCPQLNEGFLNVVPEPTGQSWLPHGRIALLAGLRNGTVPLDCCRQPFSSQKLGLLYAGGATANEPFLVQVSYRHGGVQILPGCVSETTGGGLQTYDDKSLIQAPYVARLWDECARRSPEIYRAAVLESMSLKTPWYPIPPGKGTNKERKHCCPLAAAQEPADTAVTSEAAGSSQADTAQRQPTYSSRIFLIPRRCGTDEHSVVHAADEAGEDYHYDWVQQVANESNWPFYATKRFHIMLEALSNGESVQYIQHGVSLKGRLNHGDTCSIVPIIPGRSIQTGDIVFCSTQPDDRLSVSLVWEKFEAQDVYGVKQTWFTVGNNRPEGAGRQQYGSCHRRHIYGIMDKVIEPLASKRYCAQEDTPTPHPGAPG